MLPARVQAGPIPILHLNELSGLLFSLRLSWPFFLLRIVFENGAAGALAEVVSCRPTLQAIGVDRCGGALVVGRSMEEGAGEHISS
jgi:hypothetical protein